MPQTTPTRPQSVLLTIILLWAAFYGSVALFLPPLLDDADSVHAEVAREMLLRHDYVTLHANGIRYLEKAPLFYWMMAGTMRLAQSAREPGAGALAVAARFPLALSMLALALVCEALARRMFGSARAGLYAALILLSSFGMYLFTRILIPDAMVCLWTTVAMYALWQTETLETQGSSTAKRLRIYCYVFAVGCALNVLTKGLIGVVFPVAISLVYLVASRGVGGALRRVRELHPLSAVAVFLIVATPWHLLAGMQNPGHGHPAPFVFLWSAHHLGGHWVVPMPSDGNVRGWFWFYFMNEHLLRYLSLRVPHDYDTAPLWLFWGLCLLWIMPWSAFLYRCILTPVRRWAQGGRARLLLMVWAAFPLLFFSLSSRQEYYVLPSLPPLAVLIAGWLALESQVSGDAGPAVEQERRSNLRAVSVPMVLGAVFLLASVYFLLHTPSPRPNTDLASLLTQNPEDYALSLGHFMDLTGPAIALFRVPLLLAALSLCGGPAAAFVLRRRKRLHAANLALAGGAFGFLAAVLWGLNIFSPVLTSAQLAEAIRPQVHAGDMVVIHGEYEAGSTLGFYLQRDDIHILEGRSSNLWYGSFFPDAPPIFETPATIAAKWGGPQRIFMWQSLTDPPNQLPVLPGPVYILVKSGGKEIVSNRMSR